MENNPGTTIYQDFQVRFRYRVHFTRDLFAPGNPLFREVIGQGGGEFPKKILVVLDRGVHRQHPRLLSDLEAYCGAPSGNLELVGAPLLLPGGEQVKNDPLYVTILHQAINAAGLCRHSYVAAIGGGALIDLAGYAAATAHRGLRLLRVPTTVMAQLDAAIGVKNGINAFGKKNFLGAFAPPAAVLNDSCFLTTLAPRDWIGGVAEAVKVALIKEPAFFAFLERSAPALVRRDLEVMEQVIQRGARLHLEHIAGGGDPFEGGSSRPLDFGHWSAHKLEQLSGFRLSHGEAVAMGVALDSTYSHLAGWLGKSVWLRILTLLQNLGFSLQAPELEAGPALLAGLREFQEHLGGRLTVMLLREIGRGEEVHEMDPDLVRASVALLRRGPAAFLKDTTSRGGKTVAKGAAWARRRLKPAPGNLAVLPAKEG
jgi:3-dehydroquinate synthase